MALKITPPPSNVSKFGIISPSAGSYINTTTTPTFTVAGWGESSSGIAWKFDVFGDGLISVNFSRDVPLKIRFLTGLFLNSRWSCTITK